MKNSFYSSYNFSWNEADDPKHENEKINKFLQQIVYQWN